MGCSVAEKIGLTSLDPFEEDYITFNIDGIEGYFNRTFLLSVGKGEDKKDFMITEESLRGISRKFPNTGYGPSVLREYGRIRILKQIYPRIIGEHLKPMDTECLEAEF